MEDAIRKETQKRTRELQLEVKKETIGQGGTTDAGEPYHACFETCDFHGRREERTKRRKMVEAEVRFKVPAAAVPIKPKPT